MSSSCTVLQLYPARYSGFADTNRDKSGLVYGVECSGDATIGWLPVRIPPVSAQRMYGCVEFTTMEQDASCILRWLYMDRLGNVHQLHTKSLEAEGDVARIPIPCEHIDADTAFTCALSVTPTKEDGNGGYVPVLIRTAWIEIDHRLNDTM